MLDSNLMSLLSLLSESDYLTSQTLAVKSGASSRTVQTRIGQLRAELKDMARPLSPGTATATAFR